MERLSQRESVLLVYSPQSSIMNDRSDIDFKDVFGGPPKRSSVHEMRYSYSEATDDPVFRGRDEAVGPRNSWNGLSEKPVFGEENLSRRRYPSENFFDDIFKGNESLSSSPRKRDWDPYSSSPGSRVLSPARPLPPKAEPFGSSVPAQFSLPAKLTKLTELPTFGPAHRSTFKSKDGASTGINFYSSPLSRSSSLKQGHDDKDDARSYRQSVLSQESTLSSKESSNLTKYDETDQGGDSKKDTNSSEVPNDCSQFHFSIYKWASKDVHFAIPIRRGNVSRLKENSNNDKCSGPDGRIVSESTARQLPTETLHDAELPSNDRIAANSKPFMMEHSKQNIDSPPVTSTQDRVESSQRVLPYDTIAQRKGEETKPHSKSKMVLSDKLENHIFMAAEGDKTELKPLRTLLYNDDFEQCEEKTKMASGKESKVKTTKKSSVVLDFSKNIKKQDGKRPSSDNTEVSKASSQSSTMNSGDPGKIRVKGKVKEFVKIFSQEPSPKVKTTVESQSESCRRKELSKSKAEKEVNISKIGTDEKIHAQNGHERNSVLDAERNSVLDASIMVDDLQHSQKQPSSIKNTNDVPNDTPKEKDSSSTASMPNGSKVVDGDLDDSSRENFQVKELTQDENKLPQADNDPEDIKAIDAKIRQWSNGKEGNIRSMLSTLQYVLWPESGWKPVPLVDIIEGNAVKRYYQKALLCLHPDKLQQKGAASHQKYIAKKVFDILQDSWTHFNSLG